MPSPLLTTHRTWLPLQLATLVATIAAIAAAESAVSICAANCRRPPFGQQRICGVLPFSLQLVEKPFANLCALRQNAECPADTWHLQAVPVAWPQPDGRCGTQTCPLRPVCPPELGNVRVCGTRNFVGAITGRRQFASLCDLMALNCEAVTEGGWFEPIYRVVDC